MFDLDMTSLYVTLQTTRESETILFILLFETSCSPSRSIPFDLNLLPITFINDNGQRVVTSQTEKQTHSEIRYFFSVLSLHSFLFHIHDGVRLLIQSFMYSKERTWSTTTHRANEFLCTFCSSICFNHLYIHRVDFSRDLLWKVL